MRWMLIVVMLVGCSDGNPSEEIRARAAELSSGFAKRTDVIVSKQDQTLTALAAIKSQVETLNGSILETRQAVGTMEAKLVVPQPQVKEVIKSALEPQENEGKESQPAILAASPPAVRLQFFTQENCGPCKPQSRNAQAAADELGINLETFHWEQHQDAFDVAGVDRTPHTLIVIDDQIRVRFAGIVSASTIVARVNEELGKAMTGVHATGAIFPVQAAAEIGGARFTVRSFSFWQGHNRRARVKVR